MTADQNIYAENDYMVTATFLQRVTNCLDGHNCIFKWIVAEHLIELCCSNCKSDGNY